MNDKLEEAIEKLKWLSEQISPSPIKEAIDTVVSEVEKPTYTVDDMEAFAEWCADSLYEYIGGNRWKSYDLNRIATTAQLREMWEQERRAK